MEDRVEKCSGSLKTFNLIEEGNYVDFVVYAKKQRNGQHSHLPDADVLRESAFPGDKYWLWTRRTLN